MTLKWGDLCRFETNSVGTADLAILDARAGRILPTEFMEYGETAYYSVQLGEDWESGLCTLRQGVPDYLERTEVHAKFEHGVYEEFPATKLTLDFPGADVIVAITTQGLIYMHEHLMPRKESLPGTYLHLHWYDTSEDDDPSWVEGNGQSWLHETLGTTVRGKTLPFPRLALLAITANSLTIYDATKTHLPVWMFFQGSNPRMVRYDCKRVAAKNGVICIAGGGITGLSFIDFVLDREFLLTTSQEWTLNQTISQRNRDGVFVFSDSRTIVNDACNDVAMVSRPGSMIEPERNMRMPTVGVATDGGISIIHADGRIVDLFPTTAPLMYRVDFPDADRVMGQPQWVDYGPWVTLIPDSDLTGWLVQAGPGGETYFIIGSNSTREPDLWFEGPGTATADVPQDASEERRFIGTSTALSIIRADLHEPDKGAVAYITSLFNTGWMRGDIRACWLANGKVFDRCVKRNNLTEVGTVTETQAAIGTELNAYVGFSTSNYFTQSYSADFDFGTDDFHISFWLKNASNSQFEHLFHRVDYSAGLAGAGMLLNFLLNKFYFSISDDAFVTQDIIESDRDYNDDIWHQCVVQRKGSFLQMYVDAASATDDVPIVNATGSLSNPSATVWLGIGYTLQYAIRFSHIALFRVGAGSLTFDEIKAFFESERRLFSENATCLLAGTSNNVKDVSWDNRRKELNVGTLSGKSRFQDLIRVNEDVTAAVNQIQAHDGMEATQ